jgi:hypothetical protein
MALPRQASRRYFDQGHGVGIESGSDRIRKSHSAFKVPLDPVATASGADTAG